MIDTDELEGLIRKAVADEGAFLVDFSVDQANRITIEADKDEGISLEQLGRISRKIEAALDRDEEDFALEVTSPGVGAPLKVLEQYQKNLGRPVKVKMMDGDKFSGEMIDYNDGKITLSWKERVPKETGKGKRTVKREEIIDLDKVKETRLEIRF